MIKVRTPVTQKMFHTMLLFVILILCPIAFAEETTPDDGLLQESETKCGCKEMYFYDAVNDRCLINFKKVMKRVTVVYEKNNVDALTADEMAKSIYVEGEKLFKGIIISVILFMTCASICVLSACIYCCRINYKDQILKNNVKALAKKMKRDFKSKQMAAKPASLPAVSESCSVVVEPAGVFVA